MQNVLKCSWTLVLTTQALLAPRLRKNRAIPLFPLWTFMVCSRVSYTFVNSSVNRDFRIIQLRIKQFSLYRDCTSSKWSSGRCNCDWYFWLSPSATYRYQTYTPRLTFASLLSLLPHPARFSLREMDRVWSRILSSSSLVRSAYGNEFVDQLREYLILVTDYMKRMIMITRVDTTTHDIFTACAVG